MSLPSATEFAGRPGAERGGCILCSDGEMRDWVQSVVKLFEDRRKPIPVNTLWRTLHEHDPSITKYRVRSHMSEHLEDRHGVAGT